MIHYHFVENVAIYKQLRKYLLIGVVLKVIAIIWIVV